MSNLNLNLNQHYIELLTEVNELGEVLLNEDIYNNNGVLLASKNRVVNKHFADTIAKHKLAKPIENSISLQKSLDHKVLTEIYQQQIDSLQLPENIRTSGHHQYVLRGFMLLLQFPLITQKLTVLYLQYPRLFKRSMLCAFISVAISRELALEAQQQNDVLMASMLLDVGLLHLPGELVQKETDYSLAERKMMQGHVVVAKYFADMVPGLPKGVGEAILEHHERFDGFGYPREKSGSQLGIEGQIIAMSDTVLALLNRLVFNGKYAWDAVNAVVQVSSSAHNTMVRDAALRFLKYAHKPYVPVYSAKQLPEVIKTVIDMQNNINEWFNIISQLYQLHYKELAEKQNFKPFTLLNHLNHTIVTAGLLSPFQMIWLQGLSNQISQQDQQELEEYELRLNEIHYQCLHVMRRLEMDRDRFVNKLNSGALARHYYHELMLILKAV